MESSNLSPELSQLVDHLQAHAVRIDGGPYTLRSGGISSWYIDARQTTFDGAGAMAVGAAMLEVIEEGVVAVGGMTIGADPIALAIAITAASAGRSMRAFSIRKESKDHGLGGRLVGPVGAGDRVTILEDTTTTGGALLEALDVATSEGLEVVQVVSMVDRSDGHVASQLEQRGIPYRALVTPSILGVE